MKLIRTIKLKLDIPAEAFLPTITLYTQAFNLVCKTGWETKDRNGISLHNKTYNITRKNLPSQLAVSARMKATEALKSVAKTIRNRHKKMKTIEAKRKKYPKRFYKTPKKINCPQSKQSSIRYDSRSYNTWFDKNEISLLTVEGRKKLKISVPKYFKQYIHWRRRSAELFIRGKDVFLNIVFENDVPDPVSNNKFLGIDRGVKKLAVTSDNKFYGSGAIKQVHRRYDRLRSNLRSIVDKGKRSAKRHLVNISHKANRFQRDTNHCLSKSIVASLELGSTIVLENLTGIRENCKHRKKERKDFHRWSFYQLEQFLVYKAAAKGIAVVHVDARYTSQKCSRCGYISRCNRTSQSVFRCRQCSFQLNADLNASRNIKNNHLDAICYPGRALVSEPIAPSREVEQATPFQRQ